MPRSPSSFLRDESGQGLVEYSLVLLLIAVVAITALTFAGMKVNSSLSGAGNKIPN